MNKVTDTELFSYSRYRARWKRVTELRMRSLRNATLPSDFALAHTIAGERQSFASGMRDLEIATVCRVIESSVGVDSVHAILEGYFAEERNPATPLMRVLKEACASFGYATKTRFPEAERRPKPR
jgi:hypothetical protein